MLFGVEHSRLLLLDVFQFMNLVLITANSVDLNVTFGHFRLNVSFGVLLPIVVDLLVDQTVSFFENLSNISVSFEFNVHLHSNELFHDASLSLERINLGPVRVSEVISTEVDSWSLGHNVDDDLDQSLLLKSVTCVFITFHVLQTKLELSTLIVLLTL